MGGTRAVGRRRGGEVELGASRLSFVSLFWLAWHPAAEPSTHMNALPRQSRGENWLRGVGVCGPVLLYALGSDDAHEAHDRLPPAFRTPQNTYIHYHHHNIHTQTKTNSTLRRPWNRCRCLRISYLKQSSPPILAPSSHPHPPQHKTQRRKQNPPCPRRRLPPPGTSSGALSRLASPPLPLLLPVPSSADAPGPSAPAQLPPHHHRPLRPEAPLPMHP